ncbi:MAG: NAD-dependent epimerase/dehydratase family protein [Pseudomonadota bacterium]
MSHTLIVGAGYTGNRVAQRLRDADHKITLASRTPPAIPGITPLVLDVDSADTAELHRRLSSPVDHLIYLVPPDRTAPDAADSDARFQRVLDGLEKTPNRVVLASTTGVYGNHAGSEVTEHTPINPTTARAIARVGAERTLERYATNRGLEHFTVLRIAGIYGPDRLMLDGLAEGRALLKESDTGPGNRIHVDDLALAFVLAVEHGTEHRYINVADGNPLNSTAFALAVARLARLPEPPLVDRETAQQTFSAMRLSFLNESRRVVPNRLLELLGERMRYRDPVEGARASLADMGRLKS